MIICRSIFAAGFIVAGITGAFPQASVNSSTPLPRDTLGVESGLSHTEGAGGASTSATESPTGPGTPGTTGTGALGAGPTGTMASPGR